MNGDNNNEIKVLKRVERTENQLWTFSTVWERVEYLFRTFYFVLMYLHGITPHQRRSTADLRRSVNEMNEQHTDPVSERTYL